MIKGRLQKKSSWGEEGLRQKSSQHTWEGKRGEGKNPGVRKKKYLGSFIRKTAGVHAGGVKEGDVRFRRVRGRRRFKQYCVD